MGMVVRTNTMALNAYRQLGMNNSAVAKSLEKLASGYRINRAGDDAAGLAISEKMKAQITGLETASANAQDGISLIQTAEGNLGEVHDMLNRMVELATKSANGTYTQTERDALQDEVDQLLDEIDRISKSANFNGAKLLDGSLAANNAIMESGITTADAQANTVLDGKALGVVKTNSNHVNDSVQAEKLPAFAINLEDFKVSLPANASTNITATYTISLGSIDGKTVSFYTTSAGTDALQTAATVSFTVAPNTATATEKTAAEIAGELDGKVAVIGSDVYKMAATGSKVSFEYLGQKNGNALAGKDTADGKPTDTSAVPHGDITVSVTGAGATNRVDCHVVDITDPQAGSEIVRAGAKLELTEEIINRGPLQIGDTIFTFDKTVDAPANGTPAATTKAVTIGIKGLTGDKLLQSVTEQMSHCTMKFKAGDAQDGDEYTFNIGRGSDKKTIEIEETPLAGKGYGKFTEAQLQKAFSQTQQAANAKAEITLSKDADGNFVNISEGNSLNLAGTTYTFNKDGSGTNGVQIGSDATATLNNLKAKIGSAYKVTVDAANGKITIENNSKTPAKFGAVEYTAKTVDDGGLTLQIGDTADDFNKMTVAVADMSAKGLGLDGLQITKEKLASDAIDTIKKAINDVSSARAGMGALQNRLEHTINNLDVAAENLSAANSRIRDTDMAKEMMNYTKMNVLVQSAQAMLAQANQQPQSVLQLLQ